jgi:hypothetical protein
VSVSRGISRNIARKARQNRAHRAVQLIHPSRIRPGPSTHEVARSTLQQIGILPHCGSQPTTDAIARNSVPHRSSHSVSDTGWFLARAEFDRPHFENSGCTTATAHQRPKRCLTTDAPDQAESLERPLLRRCRITARPARLRIRRRKPCFFLRFLLFGWYVRFTHGLLERPGRGGALGRARGVCRVGPRADGQQSLRAQNKPGQSGSRMIVRATPTHRPSR